MAANIYIPNYSLSSFSFKFLIIYMHKLSFLLKIQDTFSSGFNIDNIHWSVGERILCVIKRNL